MIFSDSQRQAISHAGGPALVLAGPGSGKTAVITARIHSLVNSQGIREDNILVVTFTKAAATEMRLRYKAMSAGRNSLVSFGTFHSVFFTILQHAFDLGRDNILTVEDKYNFIRDAVGNEVITSGTENDFFGDILNEISVVKNSDTDIFSYTPKCMDRDRFVKIFTEYDKRLKDNRLYDFDDMLLETFRLFRSNPKALKAWQDKFRYILVDESQDMNELQYRIIMMLAGESRNLFMVGDDDQSIYGFRGAKPGILNRFTKEIAGVKIYRLGENFRSREEIVKAASIVISDNRERFEKNAKAVRGVGGKVEIAVYDGIYRQNIDIIKRIRKLKEAGTEYRNICVLYRTNRQSALLAGMLMRAQIPFCSRERIFDIFDNREIKDVLTYLVLSQGDKKRGDFLCIMNRPVRYISRDMLTEAVVTRDMLLKKCTRERLKDSVCQLFDDLDMLKRLSPFAAINFIRKGMGYEGYISDECRKSGTDPADRIKNLDRLSEVAKEYTDISSFLRGIEELKNAMRRDTHNRSTDDGVFLSTYHGAKGLEYSAVFLPECVEGVIPYKKAVLPAEIEEERRLFYVAMTRAKDELFMYSDSHPSPFLERFLNK